MDVQHNEMDKMLIETRYHENSSFPDLLGVTQY